jgi:hypothetical protein
MQSHRPGNNRLSQYLAIDGYLLILKVFRIANNLRYRRVKNSNVFEADILQRVPFYAHCINARFAGAVAGDILDGKTAEQGRVMAAARPVVIVFETDKGGAGGVALHVADVDVFDEATPVLVGFKVDGTQAALDLYVVHVHVSYAG